MSLSRSLLLTAGFAGAFALGVWARPHLDNLHDQRVTDRQVETSTSAATASRAERNAEARRVAATDTRARLERADVSPMSSELHEKLKPLLNRGTRMEIAADGFKNAEQFAATVHAARNLEIPFMVLKDRVVTQKKSLAAAIRELKPDANALRESEVARAAAKEDVSGIE